MDVLGAKSSLAQQTFPGSCSWVKLTEKDNFHITFFPSPPPAPRERFVTAKALCFQWCFDSQALNSACNQHCCVLQRYLGEEWSSFMFLSSFFLLQSHGGPCGDDCWEGARGCSSSQCVTAHTSTHHSRECTGPGKVLKISLLI